MPESPKPQEEFAPRRGSSQVGSSSYSERSDFLLFAIAPTSSAAGEQVFHVFAAIAHFERQLISERAKDGLLAARKRGRTPCLPPLHADTVSALQEFVDNGTSVTKATRNLCIGRSTAYRVVQKTGSWRMLPVRSSLAWFYAKTIRRGLLAVHHLSSPASRRNISWPPRFPLLSQRRSGHGIIGCLFHQSSCTTGAVSQTVLAISSTWRWWVR